MNRGKGAGREGMKGRKRRRINFSDDSDEDFLVDEYEDSDDMDHADDVDDEDDVGDGSSGSDESDGKARRNNPKKKLPRIGVRRRKRRGRPSNEKADEDDEEFDPGTEYVTKGEESVVALVKKQVRKKRTRKVASSNSSKFVQKSRAANKRKRRVRRMKKPEDGFLVAGGGRLSGKGTKLKTESVKRRTTRDRKPEPPLDSDSDYIVSDVEIKGVSIGRTLETRSRSSWWLRKMRKSQAACKFEHQSQKGRRSKRSAEVDGADESGEAKTSNFCKPICGICLSEERRDTVRGRLNCCDHFFCFPCIMEWSKVESRCPMCKQRFLSINKSSRWGICMGDVSFRVPRTNQVYQPSEEELRSYLDPYANIVCMVCQEGGDDSLMLLCDVCDSSAHTYCVGLGREVPEGNWYCEGCRTFDLGASNLQQDQDHVTDQLADSSLCSEGSIGSGGDLSPQSPFCEDPGITSQVSGFGASTVMSRRTLRQQIHRLITNDRMSQTLDLAAIGSMPVDATFRSDVLKSEVEQDDGEQECFGALEDDHGGRCSTSSLTDNIGESSSRQLQHKEFFSGENLSLDGSDTRCLVDCTAVNADGSNVSHNQAQVFHSEVIYSEGTHGVEKGGSNDARKSSELHDVKEQVCTLVKRHLKSFSRDAHIDRCDFKDIARRSTHTIVAAYGYKYSSSMAMVVQPPSCCHTPDSFGLRNLVKHCCSICFNTFVGGVVLKIMKSVLSHESHAL